MCSLMAGVAGMIHASQLYSAEPASGVMFELHAIAAVVVGGTSFTGGRGTMYGTLLGAIIIGILDKGLNQAGVPSSSAPSTSTSVGQNSALRSISGSAAGIRHGNQGQVSGTAIRGRNQVQRQVPGAVIRVREGAMVTSGSFKERERSRWRFFVKGKTSAAHP
jgi:hypothetical protein